MDIRKHLRNIWTRNSFLLFILLLVSCHERNSQQKTNVVSVEDLDYYDRITSDFANRSLYMALNVLDTQNQRNYTVVVENIELYNELKPLFKDEKQYSDNLSRLLKQEDTLLINSAIFKNIDDLIVNLGDTSLNPLLAGGKMALVDSFFQNSRGGDYFMCLGEEKKQALVIYTLIKKWSFLIGRDDESGCAVISTKENKL